MGFFIIEKYVYVEDACTFVNLWHSLCLSADLAINKVGQIHKDYRKWGRTCV